MAVTQRDQVSAPKLDEGALEELRTRLRGRLILPQDADYDEIRRVFNAMIDRRPAAIARCTETHDVVEAVRFAVRHGVPVSVRGGGHGVSGHCVSDDGLMIDLSLMKEIEVDVDRAVVKAEPGLRLGEFIVATEQYGLVSPTGTVSDTGIAGLTLGAGYGWLNGAYGLAIDNLVGAEVVTADGSVVRASAEEHPDLFWAIRGGSGNFGVVTSFELRLHPVTQVLGGMLIHPFSRADEVLRFYRDVAANAPDELTVYAALLTAPDGNQAVAIVPCWCGDLEEGERVLAPIRAFGPPLADHIQPMAYSTMNTLVDAAFSKGLRHYWKQNLLRELSDGAIAAIIEHVARVSCPRSVVLIDHVHGAAHRVATTATAFPHRDVRHGLVLLTMWDDPANDAANIQWTRDLAEATRPFSTGGAYVNESWDEKPVAAFGDNYERLVEIKNSYDPTNLFRANTNIAPTVAN
ncbi:MAG: FAD-binding oxidoreductase [Chloroflexota bacterium]|nr:FAD-binding oxidoreductase [Chloroflexota bacterium]